MKYAYLVTEKKGGAQKLVEASSPSVAISAVAGENYETQRVEGPVLETLKKHLGDPVKAQKAKSDAGDSSTQQSETQDDATTAKS